MIKICIIKLGALGDVVRTTPILAAIKEKYPDSHITWITKEMSKDILSGNPKINDLLTLPVDINEEFDILYSLDFEDAAAQLANKINAKEKYGFYDMDGFPAAFNSEAEYYLNTIFDDDLKKNNRKTYQQMMFELSKLSFNGQEPELFIPDPSKDKIDNYFQENKISGKTLGFNIGSAPRWPSKAWHPDRIKEFISKIEDYTIILFGGPEEVESMEKMKNDLAENGIRVYAKNTSESLKDFFALVDRCDLIISPDTLALQTSIALKKPTIALFFCTPPWEIEGYGRVKKIVSARLDEFFPERMDEYNEDLVKSISVEQVISEI